MPYGVLLEGEVVVIIILADVPPSHKARLAGWLWFKNDRPARTREKKERSEFSMMDWLRLENNYLTQEDVR